MNVFYDEALKELDIDHIVFVWSILEEVKTQILAVVDKEVESEEAALYLEDRFEWFHRLNSELEFLSLNMIH